MKLLLDTHTFLWLLGSPEKLSRPALQACRDPDNTVWLSLVSVWEIQIKVQLKKLQLDAPLAQLVETSLVEHQFELMPIELAHILALDGLPHHHRDPFDRNLALTASCPSVGAKISQPRLCRSRFVETERPKGLIGRDLRKSMDTTRQVAEMCAQIAF